MRLRDLRLQKPMVSEKSGRQSLSLQLQPAGKSVSSSGSSIVAVGTPYFRRQVARIVDAVIEQIAGIWIELAA